MSSSREITIHLHSIDQILLDSNISFYSKRFINEYAEEYIIEEVSSLPHNSPIILKVIIPIDEAPGTEELIYNL